MKFVLAAVLLCAGAAGAAPVETVTVGSFSVAPFIMDRDGATTGILVDFFDREIAPRMGVKFKWLAPMTVARLEYSLAHNVVQFTPILAKTSGRHSDGIVFVGDVDVSFE